MARAGALDVLCQHILGMACAAPFRADELYAEIVSAEPYSRMSHRELFDKALAFVAHGGYALAGYERFAKIKQGCGWHLAHRQRQDRAELPHERRDDRGGDDPQGAGSCAGKFQKRKPRRPKAAFTPARCGAAAGCWASWRKGSSRPFCPAIRFLFGGEILALAGDRRKRSAWSSRSRSETPQACRPTRAASFRFSTYLASRVRSLLADPAHWGDMPMQVAEWLGLATRAIRPAAARRPAGGDVSARQQALSRVLSVRRATCASDARHAADPTHGACLSEAARFRRQRLCDGRLGQGGPRISADQRFGLDRRAFRAGHAGRRSRGLACRRAR